jgi:DNA ligase D-like protein (predicted 3'-phosphoesterase)
MVKDSLEQYREKRDFNKTPEPAAGGGKSEENFFVVQKHQASHLHYDFRLAFDGVLKSWAVPKGPSLNPSNRRLAVPTEDHPLAYGDFEGVIPREEYGGGTVMVWDTGSYVNLMGKKEGDERATMIGAFDRGHIEVKLNGGKLKGGFALIRTGKGKSARWLLVKMNDENADRGEEITDTQPHSIKTGRSLKDIAEEGA